MMLWEGDGVHGRRVVKGERGVWSLEGEGPEAERPVGWPRAVLSGAAALFLPAGYPSSVSSDYLAYQFWDTLQALSSYTMGYLASHAVL